MSAKYKNIISMAVFGTIGIFVKNTSISSGEIALGRAVIAMIAIITYKLITKSSIKIVVTKKEGILLFISGAAMGFNWMLLFEAYHYTTVSIATLSYYFAPIIVMIICPIFFGEKLTRRQVVCFLMSTIGLVFIIGIGTGTFSRSNLKGIILGLSAAGFYATIIIINKFIKNVSGIDRTLIQFAVAIVVLVLYVCMTTGIHYKELSSTGIINLLIIGVVHTGIFYCIYFASVKDLQGQEIAILSYIDPLVAIIVSVMLLGEGITILQVVGGVLILGFTLFNEIKIFK